MQLELTVKDIIADGFSANQILSQFFDLILKSEELSEPCKARVMERFAQVHFLFLLIGFGGFSFWFLVLLNQRPVG